MSATKTAQKATWGLRRNDEIDESLVVIEGLGGGRRYEVYRAWDRSLFCEVAVKVLRPDRVRDERAQAALAREIDVMSGLGHPNLVRLLRFRPDGDRPYLVWEFIGAGSLADHIAAAGAVGLPEVCLLGIRVCAALHHLHSRGVLHLDVKPGNVTIGDPPRLLDMSLARKAPQPLKLDRAVGTDGYMAPEQCTLGTLTPGTDIFGLGATLYEALTGMAAFSDGDPKSEGLESRYPQLIEEVLPISTRLPVPVAIERIIHACLDREPQRRPRSAVQVALVLHETLADLGLERLLVWPKGLKAVGR